MSVKGILRFAIGFCIAVGILAFAAPFAHIPRSQLFPPIFTYPGIKGRTKGVITHRRDLPTSAWFSQGEHDYFVDYSFNVKAPLILGGPPVGKVAKYTGTVLVTGDTLDKLKTGQSIPVRYDKEYPDLNGVDAPWGGAAASAQVVCFRAGFSGFWECSRWAGLSRRSLSASRCGKVIKRPA